MPTLDDLALAVAQIQQRNRAVELDKARETSRTRRLCIAVLTYGVVVLFFWSNEMAQPRLHALVPTGGFLFSTLSLVWVKQRWSASHKK